MRISLRETDLVCILQITSHSIEPRSLLPVCEMER